MQFFRDYRHNFPDFLLMNFVLASKIQTIVTFNACHAKKLQENYYIFSREGKVDKCTLI